MPLDQYLRDRFQYIAGYVSYEQMESDPLGRGRFGQYKEDPGPWNGFKFSMKLSG
jgi:hypothetical protein